MTIVIISQYFYPSEASTSQLLTDLADGLFAKGLKIKIYTGTPSNGEKSKPFTILRSPDPFQKSKSILGKLVSSLFFLLGALFFVIFKVDRKDSLLIASNPAYAGILGLVFKFLRGGKYYFLLQDVFPESALLSGIIKQKSWLVNVFNYLIYSEKLADILIELSNSPDKVKNMGLNAHQLYLKQYRLDRALKEYIEVLNLKESIQ